MPYSSQQVRENIFLHKKVCLSTMEGYQCHNCNGYYQHAILHFMIFKVLHVIHRIKNALPILLNGIFIFQYPMINVLFLTTGASKLMMVYLSLHVYHSTSHSHNCILASQEYALVNL